MKKRALIAIFAVIVVLFISFVGYVAYAATTIKTFPVSLEIVTGLKEIEIYTAPDYATPVIAMDIQQFRRGSPPETFGFRIKNTGVETLDPHVNIEPSSFAWGTVTLSRSSLGTLAPGATADFTMTITVPVTAVPGQYGFNLGFYEE